MEAAILQDLMNTTTLLRDNPSRLLDLLKDQTTSLFCQKETREAFSEAIGSVENPLQAAEVFDMIAGSSTGGIIAYLLVGGKKDPVSGKRVPLDIPSIIEFYKTMCPEIFQTFDGLSRYTNAFAMSKVGVQLETHDTTDLEICLRKELGDATLQDFDSQCIALAVLKRMEHNSEKHYDSSEAYDTRSYESIDVVDVLMATANAPTVFKTPWMIRGKTYVDGGTHANCPLSVAIPRMKELSGGGNLQSIFSVAPSTGSGAPEVFDGLGFWMGYFASRTFDGYHQYMDAKAMHPPGVFMRMWPKTKEFVDTDDLRLQKMLDAVEEEKKADPRYLQDIIVSALVIAARLPMKDQKSLFDMAQIVIHWNMLSDNAEKGLYVARAFDKVQWDDVALKNEVIYLLAMSYYGMNLLGQADKEFQRINMDSVSDQKYWIMRGTLNYHKGEFGAAIQDLEHAKTMGESALINLYLSKSLASMGKKVEALKVAEKANFEDELDDDFIKIEMLIENGKIDQAFELLKNLNVEEDSDAMAKVATLTGQCHLNKGDDDKSLVEHLKAIEYWENVYDREEELDMIPAYFQAGLAMRSLNSKKALEWLEQAYVLAMKMHKGFELSKHPWFVELSDAIKEARIAAKADAKKYPVPEIKRKEKVDHTEQVVRDVAKIAIKGTGKVVGGVASLIKGFL